MKEKREGCVVHVQDEDVILSPDYNPLEDNGYYMNRTQLAYFKRLLLDWKEDLKSKTTETVKAMSSIDLSNKSSEEGDMVNDETEILTQLRTRDRYRKLIKKIDEALIKIETGEYGYCEKSGEEIGVKRLMARPIATLSIEMQKLHEQDEDIREDSEYAHQILEFEDKLLEKEKCDEDVE